MSRRRNPRRGRPYQPLPPSRGRAWLTRLLILAVGIFLVLGAVAITMGQ